MFKILIISFLSTMSFAISAVADDAKRVDFTVPVIIDGVPLINEFKCPLVSGKRSCETPFSFGELASASLNRSVENQTFADGVKRYELATHIRDAKDWPILDDQITLIENAMGPLFAPPVLGFVAKAFAK